MFLPALDTPALLLDRERLVDNARRMGERMRALGVALRPHLKTTKCAEAGRIATEGHAGGITVSTLAEAEYFAERGFSDITYAVVVAPGKLDRAAELTRRGVTLTLLTDSVEVARAMATHAAETGARHRVLVEVDSGDGRSGVLPESETLVAIGRLLHEAEGVTLAGVLTHGGHSYESPDVEDVKRVAREEREGAVRARDRLLAAGLPCEVVSAGSTPTAVHAEDLTGITEMRPGVYLLNDLQQLDLGSCAREDLALSVLTTVIGHNRHRGHLVLDAGALALSKDRGAALRRPEVGYGEVCDPVTLGPMDGLFVTDVSQEHGVVPAGEGDFAALPIGARVRVLPNHACLTAAAYDRYQVLEQGELVATWERLSGW